MHAFGKSLSSTVKTVNESTTDSIALAVVCFRCLPTWNGEFGFDWLREKDDGLNTEPDYQNIIESGDKDGKSNLYKLESYEKLKREYDILPIARKTSVLDSTTEYFVPYLTLFSKEFVDAMPVARLIKPSYKAELKILLDIEEDLGKLEFDYDDTLFELNTQILRQNTKTKGLEDIRSTIKIKCLKDLDSDKEINIYAYPNEAVTIVFGAVKNQDTDQRKLAVKIIVLKNDSTVRKEEKFVLVSVKSNITNISNKGNAAGKFTLEEIINLYNALHQALIIPVIERTVLDLSVNKDFTTDCKYVDKYGHIAYVDKLILKKSTHIYIVIFKLCPGMRKMLQEA